MADLRIPGPYVDLGLATGKLSSGLSMAGMQIAKFGLTNTRVLKALAGQARLTADQLRQLDSIDLSRVSQRIAGIGSAVRTFAIVAVGVVALGKAIGSAREQLAEMVAVADKARDRGVNGNFFQRFVAESNRLKVEAGELESALLHAFQATQEKSPIDLSEWETGKEKISETEKALRVFNATGTKLESLVLFRDAQSQEQKIEAVLKAMVELERQGRKLEALQLGELMFGKQFVDNIRLGKTSAEQMLRTLELTTAASAGIFTDEMINRAKEVDDKLKIAQNTLSAEMRPTLALIANHVLDIKSYWADIVGLIGQAFRAFNQFDLAVKKDELARVNKVIETGMSMIPGVPSFTPMDQLTARRDRLMAEIDALEGRVRSHVVVGGGSRGAGAAPTKRETESADSRSRFDSAVDSITKRTAALEAETAAIDLGTAARERAKITAELETVAKQANSAAGINNGQITAEQARTINGLADAWANAKLKAEEANGPMATAARSAMNLNVNLQNIGVSSVDKLADSILEVSAGTKTLKESFREMSASILQDISKMLIKAAIWRAVLAGMGGMGGGLGNPTGVGLHTPGGFSAAFPMPFKNGGLVATSIAHSGTIKALAEGGMISGPGGPRSDSILAALSDGEFVINAAATKKHRALLEAINSGFSLKPMMPALATGGGVGLSAQAIPETCFVGKIGGSDVRIHC